MNLFKLIGILLCIACTAAGVCAESKDDRRTFRDARLIALRGMP